MWLLLTVLIWASSGDLLMGSAAHPTEASCQAQGDEWRAAVEKATPPPRFGPPTAAHAVCLRADARGDVV